MKGFTQDLDDFLENWFHIYCEDPEECDRTLELDVGGHCMAAARWQRFWYYQRRYIREPDLEKNTVIFEERAYHPIYAMQCIWGNLNEMLIELTRLNKSANWKLIFELYPLLCM